MGLETSGYIPPGAEKFQAPRGVKKNLKENSMHTTENLNEKELSEKIREGHKAILKDIEEVLKANPPTEDFSPERVTVEEMAEILKTGGQKKEDLKSLKQKGVSLGMQEIKRTPDEFKGKVTDEDVDENTSFYSSGQKTVVLKPETWDAINKNRKEREEKNKSANA